MAAPMSELKIHHWNYRVLRRPVEDLFELLLIEVYYDARDEIILWSEAGPLMGDDDIGELAAEARLRLSAVELARLSSDKRRVLTPDDLPTDPGPVLPGEQ